MRWLPLTLLLACSGGKDADSTTPTGAPAGTAAGTPSSGSPSTGSPGTGTPGTGTPTGTATGNPCALVTFADGLTPSAEVHVDDAGSDATGDGTAGNPYATLERAAGDAVPGTAIVVHEGTYAGGDFLTDLRGTAQAPIWVGGAAGEARPVIEGGAEALHLIRPAYVVLHDLEARNTTANGINIDDGGDYADPDAAHHVVVRDVFIHDIGTGGNNDCLKLSGLRNHTVVDSEFARCGGGISGSGVDHVGCHDGLIANNRFTELSGSGVQTKGGSTNITIRGNWFEDAGERALNLGGSTGTAFFRPPLDPANPNAEARGLKVHANVFIGSTSPLAFVGCTDCEALHNTLIDPGNWLVRILQESVTDATWTFDETANGTLANNQFVFRRADVGTEVNVGANTQADTFTWTNNGFWASDDPGNSQPNLPGTETGTVLGEPVFADVEYRPDGASPALGAGAPTTLVCDRDGRPFDPTSPAIGAYAAP